MVILSAQAEGCALPLLLEAHAGQHIFSGEILRAYAHQQSSVDIGSVPGAQAHAVGDHAAPLRSGRHHLSAGTDAEGKGRAAIWQMAGQLIIRGRQLLKGLAVLLTADGVLIVLNAYPNGKVLLFHGHSRIPEHPEGIPGGVSGGQDQGIAGQAVLPLRTRNSDFLQSISFQHQALQPVAEADVAPQSDKLLPDGLHHLAQHIRPHVGLVGIFHISWGSRLHQRIQHRSNPRVVGASGQLSVGKRTGSSLAELNIGALIQLAPGPELLHIRRPGVYILPPLQHNGGDATAGQVQCGKQSRRSHPHHHRGQRGGAFHLGEDIAPPLHQGDVLPGRSLHQPLLLGHGQLHCIDIVGLVLIPGINGLPDNLQLPQLPWAYAQGPGRPLAKLLQISPGRQGQISNADHAITILFFGALPLFFLIVS